MTEGKWLGRRDKSENFAGDEREERILGMGGEVI